MINANWVILGAIINLAGAAGYITSTLRGHTQPNRVSWALWAAAPLIAFGGEIQEGVGIRSLMTFMVGFTPLLIFLASFVNRKSYWKITRFDFFCGALSITALVLWGLTRTGDIAIVLSLLADGAATAATVRKAWVDPASEHGTVFLFGAANSGIALLTITTWTLANSAFPIYIFAADVGIFTLVWLRTRRVTLAAPTQRQPAQQ